ncbi:OmpA family protein [Deltaproteobacteria bacterium TL4]
MRQRKQAESHKVAKWLLTFADLITLLLCFFIYLSLRSKPNVNLFTPFMLSDQVLKILESKLPESMSTALRASGIRKESYANDSDFLEAIHRILGDNVASEHDNQFIIASQSVETHIIESKSQIVLRITLTRTVSNSVVVPLIFEGNAVNGGVHSQCKPGQGISPESVMIGVDYVRDKQEVVFAPKQNTVEVVLCLINDKLNERREEIRVSLGRPQVKEGAQIFDDRILGGLIMSQTLVIDDDDEIPVVKFRQEESDVRSKEKIAISAILSEPSGLDVEIPLELKGTAQPGSDYRLTSEPKIVIPQGKQEGILLIDVLNIQGKKTLEISMKEQELLNAVVYEGKTHKITFSDTIKTKDCSGIENFLNNNSAEFGGFKLISTKRRCILTLPEDFLFASGSATIREDKLESLKAFLGKIKVFEELANDSIRVEGHTDDVPFRDGGMGRNWELSADRATTVAWLMMNQLGYDPLRISTIGFAYTQPMVSIEGKSGAALNNARKVNRRVDVVFAETSLKECTQNLFPEAQRIIREADCTKY